MQLIIFKRASEYAVKCDSAGSAIKIMKMPKFKVIPCDVLAHIQKARLIHMRNMESWLSYSRWVNNLLYLPF